MTKPDDTVSKLHDSVTKSRVSVIELDVLFMKPDDSMNKLRVSMPEA